MRKLLLVTTLLAALSTTAESRAQEEEVMSVEAKARFKEGLALMKGGRMLEARAKYLQALAVAPQAYTPLLNLAIVEFELKKYPESYVHLRSFLNHPKAEPKLVEGVKKEMLPELTAKVAQLRILAKDGADVTVDGSVVGRAPLAETWVVEPGSHTIASYKQEAQINALAGQTRDVDVRPPAPPVPAPTPAPSATTSASFTPPPTPPPERPSNTRYYVAGGLAVGAVAGLAVGTWMGISANEKVNDTADLRAANPGACANRGSATCVDADTRANDASKGRLVSILAFGVGGAFALGSLATLVLWPTSSNAALGVQPTHGGGALWWQGRF